MKTALPTQAPDSDGFMELAALTLQRGDLRESNGVVGALATLMRRAAAGNGSVSLQTLSLSAEDAKRVLELPQFFAVDGPGVRLPRYAEDHRELHSFFERQWLAQRRVFGDADVRFALDSILPCVVERNSQGETIFENSQQRLAVAGLLDCRVGILTGGPGTGKTTTASALLAVLKRLHPALESGEVLVTAPTGKAACRIGESIGNSVQHLQGLDLEEQRFLKGIRAVTLHRALEWGPIPPEAGGPFRRGPSRPLEARWVIVDEASMVDLELMRSLVRALRSDASLILLGDGDQLESVEVGGLLPELVRRGSAAGPAQEPLECLARRVGSDAATVEGQFRMGLPAREWSDGVPLPGLAFGLRYSRRAMHAPWILDLAEAVRPASNRSYAVMRACIEGNAGHLSFLKDASRKAFRDFLEVRWKPWVEASKSWFGLDEAELEQQRAALCWLRRFQLLCSDNAQVERANGWGMQFLANGEAMRGNAVPHGCPVLIQKNSPALALTNGDLGIAVALPGERIASMVGFDSGEGSARWFPMARLPAYSPAFGLTIHKSQGSEWEEVAIELPDAASGEMLTRNLLYTAVTRASRNVHLIGAEEGLKRLIPE